MKKRFKLDKKGLNWIKKCLEGDVTARPWLGVTRVTNEDDITGGT